MTASPVHNIFVRHYHGEENYWTEGLIKFLANCDAGVLNALLRRLGLNSHVRSTEDVEFATQVRVIGQEGRSVPDALVASEKAGFALYFEAKVGEDFDPGQANRHLSALATKTLYKERALVLVTSARRLTDELKSFALEARRRRIAAKVIGLSWNDLHEFLLGLTALRPITRFLVDHYRSHLHEEVLMESWGGFDAQFAQRWSAMVATRGVADAFATQVHDEVDSILGRMPGMGTASGTGRTAREKSNVYRSWELYKKGKEWVRLYAGLWAEEPSDPTVFVSCWWSDGCGARLKGRRASKTLRLLKAHRFYVESDYLGRDLAMSRLAGKLAQKQSAVLREFLKSTVEVLVKSGLVGLLTGPKRRGVKR
ncbi:MAG: hypothetical protein NTX53_06370 [candidate division WOR-3 bacterium]|nr:hypothetical protein [candidate division WOR-3 bacterium]